MWTNTLLYLISRKINLGIELILWLSFCSSATVLVCGKTTLFSIVQFTQRNNYNFLFFPFFLSITLSLTTLDFGLKWVLTGHSERRHKVASETSELVAQKTKAALTAGLNVIACIGEKLEEREANSTMAVCQSQLQPLLDMIPSDSEEWNRVVIAYEPVWAIGTGLTASPEQAEEVHNGLRNWLSSQGGEAGAEMASKVRIIYGGSVKPANAELLIAMPNIDGFLVGGCSLKTDILDICRSCQ